MLYTQVQWHETKTGNLEVNGYLAIWDCPECHRETTKWFDVIQEFKPVCKCESEEK